MHRSLLVGFNEFLEWNPNPARLVVEALQADESCRAELGLIAEVLPTEFAAAGGRIVELIHAHRPEVVVIVGLAGGRPTVCLERVALNLNDSDRPDNAGHQPQGVQITGTGPLAYFSTLPLPHLLETLQGQGVPVAITNFAGTFVCNHTFYVARHTLETLHIPAACGLVHIPLMAEHVTAPHAHLPRQPAQLLIAAVKTCLRESLARHRIVTAS